MRLHGWCTECRRAKLVRVSNHAMAMLAIRQIPTGICDDCERKEEDERTARYQRNRPQSIHPD